MDQSALEIYNTLRNLEPDTVNNFFNERSSVNPNLTSSTREKLKRLFSQNFYHDFDDFVVQYHQAISPPSIIPNDSPVPRPNPPVLLESNHFKDPWIISENCFHSDFRKPLTLKKLPVQFNVTTFLKEKHKNQDYYCLDFRDEEDIKEELEIIKSMSSCSTHTNIIEAMKKLAELVELLNHNAQYPILNIYNT